MQVWIAIGFEHNGAALIVAGCCLKIVSTLFLLTIDECCQAVEAWEAAKGSHPVQCLPMLVNSMASLWLRMQCSNLVECHPTKPKAWLTVHHPRLIMGAAFTGSISTQVWQVPYPDYLHATQC